ncbi:MAG: GNAT family N-acetyltransferase [Acidobacteria bacterium]|nr:GNAT family N-acetyltransferase [Acidobacteriota bacterium]
MRLLALEDAPAAFGLSVEEHRRTTAETVWPGFVTSGDGSFVLGAFVEGALAGMAGLFRERKVKTRHKAELWGVYVKPAWRGRGMARALVAAVLERAGCEGVEQVQLTVSAGQGEARRLYESLGFQTFGVEPQALKLDSGYVDYEHMVLRLATNTKGAG